MANIRCINHKSRAILDSGGAMAAGVVAGAIGGALLYEAFDDDNNRGYDNQGGVM
jgi:hypothetical protein